MRSLAVFVLVLNLVCGCDSKTKSATKPSDKDAEDRPTKTSPTTTVGSSHASGGAKSVGPLAGFVKHSSGPGKFTAMFPVQPNPPIEQRTKSGDTEAKVVLTVAETEQTAFLVSYMDIPSTPRDIRQFLKGSVDGWARGTKATLTSTKDVTLAGKHQGMHAVADGPGAARFYYRVFAVVGDGTTRQYQLVVGGTEEATAQAFFDAFALLP